VFVIPSHYEVLDCLISLLNLLVRCEMCDREWVVRKHCFSDHWSKKRYHHLLLHKILVIFVF
jgi:hypothetical protein